MPNSDDHYACHPAECEAAAEQLVIVDAIRTGRVAAAEDILEMSRGLGDEGWNALADQAAEAGYDRHIVLRRRRPEDSFTAMTIEAAYQYGYRQAAEVARGVTRPNAADSFQTKIDRDHTQLGGHEGGANRD